MYAQFSAASTLVSRSFHEALSPTSAKGYWTRRRQRRPYVVGAGPVARGPPDRASRSPGGQSAPSAGLLKDPLRQLRQACASPGQASPCCIGYVYPRCQQHANVLDKAHDMENTCSQQAGGRWRFRTLVSVTGTPVLTVRIATREPITFGSAPRTLCSHLSSAACALATSGCLRQRMPRPAASSQACLNLMPSPISSTRCGVTT